ncbi:aspartate--tRNA ligase [Candidatus Saccharibacteria bacterium]|jgi:aspartyl-tRNA synthetase|nr:aspartate--tRNA ligase [Candidatus Saccharibacteria bacterium]
MKKRYLSIETPQLTGRVVTVAGWVHSRRDHGGLIFIDLRDHTGIVQLVINPDNSDLFSKAEDLRDEFVIQATGEVTERGEGLINPAIASGNVELVVSDIKVLNQAETLPIQPFSDQQANEELRLRYRYLDLRRPKMQNMLKKRSEMFKIIRSYMDEHDFTEVATPILANSSPEGARDFLIPSRLHEGKFYALPQAPQQFKQLLMVGGLPRYYQLAACFRDEDPRADRLYGEFYQLDVEMSFVDNGETVRRMFDPLMSKLATEFANKKLLFDEIPRISYKDAMDRYGSDKPDLRFGMELIELTDVFSKTDFGVFRSADCIKAICVEKGSSLSRKQIDNFTEIAKSEGAGGLAYITYDNGEAKSPIAKFLSSDELEAIKHRTGAKDGDTVFFGADKRSVVNTVLGRLRNEFANHFNLKDPDVIAFCWVVDFPFYEWNESGRGLDFGHNPFSMPKGGIESIRAAKTDEDKLTIVADQYDMVMNGYEICSGGVRNHNPETLYEVFRVLGFSKEYVEEKFGAMINAFKYGAPPHAGLAFGVDRIIMEFLGEKNIREVIAFPKNGSGVDVMMNSPSLVDESQRKEIGL